MKERSFARFRNLYGAVCQCLSGRHHIASPIRIGAGGVADTGRSFPFLADIFCQYRQYIGRRGKLGSGAQIRAAEIKKMVSCNNRPAGTRQPLVSAIWGVEFIAQLDAYSWRSPHPGSRPVGGAVLALFHSGHNRKNKPLYCGSDIGLEFLVKQIKKKSVLVNPQGQLSSYPISHDGIDGFKLSALIVKWRSRKVGKPRPPTGGRLLQAILFTHASSDWICVGLLFLTNLE